MTFPLLVLSQFIVTASVTKIVDDINGTKSLTITTTTAQCSSVVGAWVHLVPCLYLIPCFEFTENRRKEHTAQCSMQTVLTGTKLS